MSPLQRKWVFNRNSYKGHAAGRRVSWDSSAPITGVTQFLLEQLCSDSEVSQSSIFRSLHNQCQKARCYRIAANTNAQGPTLHSRKWV